MTFVDGFCGGGVYRDGTQLVSGTPLLLCEAVEDARRSLNVGRAKPIAIDPEFYFLDRNPRAVDYLRSELVRQGRLSELGRSIHLSKGVFETNYPAIKRSIEARTTRGVGRSIFVLDQKGYTSVPVSIIRDILSAFSGGEVILTFAVDWLIDYLSDKPQAFANLPQLEIGPDAIREYMRLKNETGGRYLIQRLLKQHIQQATGARFISPFFIRSGEANKDLWIVHLSNNQTARNVMVAVHWLFKNHSWHPGQGGLEILGFDPKLDSDALPDFWFGDKELEVMHDRLAEDVLRRIRDNHKDAPVRYVDFLSSVANETPARLIDFDEVATNLVAYKELKISTSEGNTRRAAKPGKADLIGMAAQTTFVYLKDQRPVEKKPRRRTNFNSAPSTTPPAKSPNRGLFDQD